VVSGLGNELENVKKAANIDTGSLTGTVAKLGHQLIKTRDFLNSDMMKSIGEDSGFHQTLKSFVENAEIDVTYLFFRWIKNFIKPNSTKTKVTPENWILSPQSGKQLICNNRTKTYTRAETQTK
jgi:hypothetical protein